jgi:hypothetical protein
MANKPKFLSSLAPEHQKSLKAERDDHADREKSDSRLRGRLIHNGLSLS